MPAFAQTPVLPEAIGAQGFASGAERLRAILDFGAGLGSGPLARRTRLSEPAKAE
jgi:hypothetical protein